MEENLSGHWFISETHYGPPGIGCLVISSLSGANLAVIVTEPASPNI